MSNLCRMHQAGFATYNSLSCRLIVRSLVKTFPPSFESINPSANSPTLTCVEYMDVHGSCVVVVLARAVASEGVDLVVDGNSSMVDPARTTLKVDHPALHLHWKIHNIFTGKCTAYSMQIFYYFSMGEGGGGGGGFRKLKNIYIFSPIFSGEKTKNFIFIFYFLTKKYGGENKVFYLLFHTFTLSIVI